MSQRRVSHKVVKLPGTRPIVQHGASALAKLPVTVGTQNNPANLPPETLVWLGVKDCGCGWGWALDAAKLSPSLERRLMRADQVEDELRHTAVHHLVAGGLSQEHHDAPGCSR